MREKFIDRLRRRVLLGGAALTRRYVESDCRAAYTAPDKVHYAKDACGDLKLMSIIMETKGAPRA